MLTLATRILVILTLAFGAAGLRVMHVAHDHEFAHESASAVHASNASNEIHNHADDGDCHHDAEYADAEHDCDGNSSHDEHTCETCVTLLALAFQTLDIPALVLTERVTETLTIAPTATPANVAINANRARPPPIA